MKRITFLTIIFLVVGLFATSFAQVDVTFQVDMAEQTVNPAGVSVAGNFQMAAGYPADWTPGSTWLTQVGATSVYA
nr:hypothetical protein [Bacteroidota bacterium]